MCELYNCIFYFSSILDFVRLARYRLEKIEFWNKKVVFKPKIWKTNPNSRIKPSIKLLNQSFHLHSVSISLPHPTLRARRSLLFRRAISLVHSAMAILSLPLVTSILKKSPRDYKRHLSFIIAAGRRSICPNAPVIFRRRRFSSTEVKLSPSVNAQATEQDSQKPAFSSSSTLTFQQAIQRLQVFCNSKLVMQLRCACLWRGFRSIFLTHRWLINNGTRL